LDLSDTKVTDEEIKEIANLKILSKLDIGRSQAMAEWSAGGRNPCRLAR
jgi:hypothetical protein